MDNVNKPIIICNDILTGTMGEKTMWDFLLEGIPNAIGIDTRTVGSNNYSELAKNYINTNYPSTQIIVQNASYIDIIDSNKHTISYLQDNLRQMYGGNGQQEHTLSLSKTIVSNSKHTASSYPEYNIKIIPIGVNHNLFFPRNKEISRAKYNIPTNQSVGIFVGSFTEIKGWSQIKKIILENSKIFWILVSKDNGNYDTINSITFNRINQQVLSELLNCADFFIVGSPVETQCLAAIEAGFCNIPIIMQKTGIFADYEQESLDNLGYFGDDLRSGINYVLNNKWRFNPRQELLNQKLTINDMIFNWKKLIAEITNYGDNKLNKILLICPSRQRMSRLEECIRHWKQNTDGLSDFLVILDNDDEHNYERIESVKYMVIEPPEYVHEHYNIAVNKYIDDYEYILLLGDDVLFRKNGWEHIFINAMQKQNDWGLVFCNDGNNLEVATAPMLSAKFIKALGYVHYPKLHHGAADTVLTDICKSLNIITFIPEMYYEHMHPCAGKAPWDATYLKSRTTGQYDWDTYIHWRENEMDNDVRKVLKVMNADNNAQPKYNLSKNKSITTRLKSVACNHL